MSTPRPTTTFNHPYPPQQPPSLHHPPPHPPPPPTVEFTIISGKQLKNVNWKNGDLKPYAIFWVDPDHKLTTKSDDFSGTKPVWNQRFSLPTPSSAANSGDIVFTLEVFHSKAAETPKPFVGSLSIRLSSLPEPENVSKVRTFELLRPSGRPQGKIRLKIGLNYQNFTTSYGGFYYGNGPQFGYPYYGGSGYGAAAAPSAPVDYSPYETRSRFGVGVGVGAVGGALGGLALDDGVKYENENVVVGCSSSTVKDDFSEYRADY